MKKIDRRIIIVAAFIFIVGLAYGLMRFLIAQKEEPPRRVPGGSKRLVQTEMVQYSTITSPVVACGRLNSVSEIDIVAEASGKIIPGAIPLKKGSAFNQGDLLFTIYRDEVLLALQARKSQFMNTLANILPDMKFDFPEHEDSFIRFFGSIYIDKDLPDLPVIKNDKLKIFLASRNLLSDYYSIKKDELQLSRHSVYAPFNGTFSEVYLEAGAYTNMGGRVAYAIQTDILELEVPVKREDAKWINIGDKVMVSRADQSIGFGGKIVRKGSFLDDDSQTQAVFIRIKNSKNFQILNGEYLTATFPGYPVDNVMEIPRRSVFNLDEVFIVVDGRLEKRKIEIVKKNEKSLIFTGLEEGTLLVTQALINVQEGIMVVTEAEMKAGQQGAGKKNNNK
ncbi:MAG: HlyD family efflux transporter periplasmic adaptor subunit [Bacteroidales bacterium]|nr:HlyD family efflux transporter periplasmic adaptor subunit [Bacteroidales bacterium]